MYEKVAQAALNIYRKFQKSGSKTGFTYRVCHFGWAWYETIFTRSLKDISTDLKDIHLKIVGNFYSGQVGAIRPEWRQMKEKWATQTRELWRMMIKIKVGRFRCGQLLRVSSPEKRASYRATNNACVQSATLRLYSNNTLLRRQKCEYLPWYIYHCGIYQCHYQKQSAGCKSVLIEATSLSQLLNCLKLVSMRSWRAVTSKLEKKYKKNVTHPVVGLARLPARKATQNT